MGYGSSIIIAVVSDMDHYHCSCLFKKISLVYIEVVFVCSIRIIHIIERSCQIQYRALEIGGTDNNSLQNT